MFRWRRYVVVGALLMLVGGIGVARAGVVGVVEAIDATTITVLASTYVIDESTTFTDRGGATIHFEEIHRGTSVELEFDEHGRLAAVAANVVR